MDCVACGAGLTTEQEGAVKESDCVPLPGWTRAVAADNTVLNYGMPCNVGSYSLGGAGAVCVPCKPGSSTEYPMASAATQCSVCAPGWGLNEFPTAYEGLCKQW
jgi:hypothetical protein